MNPPTYPFEETSFMDDPLDELFKIGHGVTSITNNQVIAFKLSRAYMSL